MEKRLIIFLVRRQLGLKKFEYFEFENQASDVNYYYFTSDELIKVIPPYKTRPAHVSLNWLLNKNCKVKKLA